jgi:integrase
MLISPLSDISTRSSASQSISVSHHTVHLYRAALKLLYVKTLRRPWFDELVARIRRRPKLQPVLSAEEITRILDHTTNLKHWAIIATFYSTGLRCNELRLLKVGDIDSQRMVIHVREAKGGIPRDIGLSPVLLERLRIYWRWRKPHNWLSLPRCVLTSRWSERRFASRAGAPGGVPASTNRPRTMYTATMPGSGLFRVKWVLGRWAVA